MKIPQGFLLLLLSLTLVHAADKKTKKTEKTEKSEKSGVKRQIGYGLEAIPGVAAIHAPLQDEYFAVGRPTAHGGVQPLGIIHNSPGLDNIGGFTSHGFDALQPGFGLYAAPHAYIATPIVNVQHGNVPNNVELDQGHGYGSIKHGHQIAQSLTSKNAVPVHENVFDVPSFAPQFDFGKGKHSGFNHNLVPSHPEFRTAGFSTGPKGFVSFPNVKPVVHTPHHGTPAPKGYSFATLHAPQTHFNGHSAYGGNLQHSQVPVHSGFDHGFHLANNQVFLHGHNIHSSHKAQSGHAAGHGMGHGSISHGHHLAKNFQVSGGHLGLPNHGFGKGHFADPKHFGHESHSNGFHGNAHSAAHGSKKVGSSSHNYHIPSAHGLISPSLSHGPSGPNRVSSHSGEYLPSHDSSSRSSPAFNSEFNRPSAKVFSSSEHSDPSSASHTNGHGGGHKATSFQSFVIHSYKPANSAKKQEYDSHESDENYSGPSYSSAQAQSGESHF